ncbi:UDP-N-acetylmuramate--L-alanine ligase [Candidatus Peregrinibacteria bacterium]|nr:UDP-N-acetylmuramate--L-alanine ligase [Candidatus Peregrinibacteria bacterium]
MSLLDKKYIHFVGIGGIGTSGLAQILRHQGRIISGSDMSSSEITKSLKHSGIKVEIGHKSSNVSKKHELLIYSPAIPKSNPELKRAEELKIKMLSYPEALGELSKEYFTIAISGAHGKSTTTAITALLLKNAGLDPTVIIGTKIKEFGNQNFRVGKSKYLVVEACEYKRSFLNINPDILVITNIEADHLDYYKGLNDYKKAFTEMSKKVKKGGIIIINGNDKNSVDAIKNTKSKVIKLSGIKKMGIKIEPKVVGAFNKLNASMAAIVGDLLKIPKEKIEKSISAFKGSWRRLEEKKRIGKTKIIDDYAHHPTEITMTLEAIREENPHAKILCVFQPHQYNRTIELLKGFGNSFHNVDEVIIPNIYKVRDKAEDITKICVKTLVDEINKNSKRSKAKDGHGLENTAKFISKNHSRYGIIITMGAGDIYDIHKLF